ncbi:Protein kinase domain [Macleaya cordata]|uniref:Protein kinase domain n=1 Tax=Macleaya cordata TaxID=56857 RepID=A0A200QYA9_MACCD|nr:Protein kinase domain [Macleaya cordata]
MDYFCPFRILCLLWLLLIPGTHQLQSSQTQVLQQLRKHLEYPKPLEVWNDYSGDLCNIQSSLQLSLVCEDNSVTELKIMGEGTDKVSKFDGFPILNQTLSSDFSIDSFFTTLSRLTNLKALSLISLGIWGPLSDKIHRLYSLESLDLSANFLYGSIPPKISAMAKLQILTLDGNFFNDTVPNWFDSLYNLTILSLKNNQLKGPFPFSICKIKTLTALALSHNNISGKLPNLGSLTSLHVLDLRENQIDSELPVMPKGLVTVLLSKNSFDGEIPEEYGELNQLQHLDLSFNFLQRTPPASLFSLPNISYLNLASNMLSGSLPYRLDCGGVLGYVDISTNKLTGGLPSCLRTTSDKRVIKVGGNCLSVDTQHQHPESYCENVRIKKESGSGVKAIVVLIGVIIGIVIFMALLAFGLLILFRRYCQRGSSEQHLLPKAVQENSITGFSSELLANARFISQAAKLGTQGVPTYRLFSIEELKEATNNFDQSTFLGEGSIGKIYKGKLENGTYVAIRCLALFKRDSIRNLKLRLDLLSKLRHPHLVCLLGHCIDGGERDDSTVNRVFLIYEYVPNGSLHTYISEDSEKILKWSERLAVLIGIAKAVHFLHTGIIPGFLNNRLKANNILLDEHRIAKLSDYGLSIITKEIDKLEVGLKLQMTKIEDDVYSFGFILLEMLVGPTAARRGESYLLNEMASFSSQDSRRRIVDPVVLSTCSQESLSIVISITNKCISTESSTRPSFEDVLWNLQYASQVQATADGDQRPDVATQP